MTNSADLGGWYPPRPKAEVEKSSWLIYAPWREGCNHKRPYRPMLPTLYIKCKESHLAILSTWTEGIFRVRPYISLAALQSSDSRARNPSLLVKLPHIGNAWDTEGKIILTLGRTRRGWMTPTPTPSPPPPKKKVFLSFFLQDKTLGSSCSNKDG